MFLITFNDFNAMPEHEMMRLAIEYGFQSAEHLYDYAYDEAAHRTRETYGYLRSDEAELNAIRRCNPSFTLEFLADWRHEAEVREICDAAIGPLPHG